MKIAEYNAQTGETTFTEVPDVEMPVIEQPPTTEEILADLVQLLADKGVIY